MNEVLLAAALAAFPAAGIRVSVPGAPTAPMAGPAWTRGSIKAPEGIQLRYRYRPGAGSPVLLVHGLGVGASGFDHWLDFFPGRPLMILERRGYGSPAGRVDEDDVGAVNQDDVSAAVEEARRLSGSARVGVLGYSLGAMILPPPDPSRVLWIALVCPGVPGMAQDLPASEQALEAQTRYWFGVARAGGPASLDAWLSSVMAPGILELSAKARSLGLAAAADEVAAEAASPVFMNLYTQESLWAYAQQDGFSPDPLVPVFVGYAENDLVVPPAAVKRRAQGLAAAGARLDVAHWPGDHLDALADPALVRPALEAFDAASR
jgi:pimeloyl-ACP methyl ester carboxylesterase